MNKKTWTQFLYPLNILCFWCLSKLIIVLNFEWLPANITELNSARLNDDKSTRIDQELKLSFTRILILGWLGWVWLLLLTSLYKFACSYHYELFVLLHIVSFLIFLLCKSMFSGQELMLSPPTPMHLTMSFLWLYIKHRKRA